MDRVAEQLRKARQAKGIELKEVKEATKIRSKYLQALEEEDYNVLPGLVYTVGFLRSYARFLDLDADNLVSTFREEITETESGAVGDDGTQNTKSRPQFQSLITKILHYIQIGKQLLTSKSSLAKELLENSRH